VTTRAGRLPAARVASVLVLAACAPALAQKAPAQEPDGVRTVSFERLNRVYEQLIDDLSLIRIGPAEVALRSPEHSLTVSRHAATLTAGDGGLFEAGLELDISGSGQIAADVVIGSLESQLTQELVVPDQTLRLEGAITVRRDDEGYWIRTERMPATTQVRIESELGTQLFTVCRQMALVLVSLDCEAIERAVTLISVPLPEAGGEYLIALEDTTPEEREDFDRFLGQSRTP
jgi:hypothetical protein